MGVTSEQIDDHLHRMNYGCGKLSRNLRPIHYGVRRIYASSYSWLSQGLWAD